MVKRVLAIAIVSLLLIWGGRGEAKISAYLGARTNYAGVGAARLGVGAWELGMFAPSAFAINKIFKIGSKFYATLGFGATFPSTPAVVAGAGWHYSLPLRFGMRAELYAIQGASGYGHGAATLGLSWNY
jgi:hypothetical protein